MGYKYFQILLVLLLVTLGCKDKEPDNISITHSDLSMKVNFKYGSESLAYGQEYAYETDKKIKFELVKFYVSKPAFLNEKGDWVSAPTEYYLIDLAHPTLSLGKLPVGNYSALQFGVGVDNSRNIETDPQAIPATDYPTDHPLNYAQDMYWGWSSGYIFVKLEGRIDVNNNGSYADAEDKAFSYHPGVADLYRTVNFTKNIQLDEEIENIEISLDMVKLLVGVKLVQYPVAHPNGTASPEYTSAKFLMDNFPVSFE